VVFDDPLRDVNELDVGGLGGLEEHFPNAHNPKADKGVKREPRRALSNEGAWCNPPDGLGTGRKAASRYPLARAGYGIR
jgi:hypothetical protein